MSRYTDALSAFIAAEREFSDASTFAQPNQEEAAQRLAQAGDVLESEVRQMMREEISAGVLARYTADG